ncbi:MAG: hypothetical protein CM1200mP1_04840 [Candidatus Neomarinimicrobiota bacterium]|nr:MAG: hypothetical protein CM1200mP1_04840 [Candidatus Neomarinimicrobiota bacterium]
MKIFLAKDAGYCFGVRDAVNLAYESAENMVTYICLEILFIMKTLLKI